MKTIADLLQVDDKEGTARVRAGYDEFSKMASSSAQPGGTTAGHLARLAAPGIVAALSDAVLRQLRMTSLAELVDSAWNDASAIRAALAKTRDASSGPETVALSPHSLTITNPMRVEIDGVEQPALEPMLTIALAINGVVLTIEHGRVTKWSAAIASATAELRLDQVLVFPVSRVKKEFEIGVIDIRAADAAESSVELDGDAPPRRAAMTGLADAPGTP